ncbi:MAG: SDR family oxidoreductase [Acidimicrobiales bacterium]
MVCGRSTPDEGPARRGPLRRGRRDRPRVRRCPGRHHRRRPRPPGPRRQQAPAAPPAPTATASPRFSQKIIALNLTSALHVTQAANRVMQQQEAGGSIISIGSLSGLRPSPGTAAYGAAKAGLLSLTTTLAMELAPKVRVNMVSAGMVRTEIFEDYYGGPEGAASVARTVPLQRVAEPADIGNAVAFLASPLAGFISGANLLVHGGGEQLAFFEHQRG